ncbi:hypothetical protein [Streptomyces sp. IBSNAI001]|uniref:hypothetical protein n=1 Tax=Streptomyces sp. IBSNAI001 TaxID=3457499 RepID=UPI003FD211BA
MAKTGPQKYPGASTKYWYQSTFGGSAMESNVGVMHTTEGWTVPSYGGGGSAPNFTALPDIKNKKLVWYQHFDFDVSSRALVNKSGGVETNTANAVQVELVGTCDERHATTWDGKRAGVDYIFWPDAPDWALAELAKFVKWAHDEHSIPLRSTVSWKAYKKGQVGGSYGANGVRLTGAQWNAYYGWLGHQHVPENDHGDPGDLNFARVLALAAGKTEAPTQPTTPAPTPVTAPVATPPKESDVPTLITEVVAGGPDLKAGEWKLLQMAKDTAIAQGPCRYTFAAYVVVTGTPGTRVVGRFHDLPLATGKPSLDLRQDAGVIGADGTLNAVFTRPGELEKNEQLKLEVLVDAPAKVTHRLVRGLRWTI